MKIKNIRRITFFLAMILLTGPMLSLFNSISYGLEIEEINKEINSEDKAIDTGVDNLKEKIEEEKFVEEDNYKGLEGKEKDESNSNQDKLYYEGNSLKNKEKNMKFENNTTDIPNENSLKKDNLLIEPEISQIQFSKVINGDEVFNVYIERKEIELEEDDIFIETLQNIILEDDISIYNDDMGNTYKLDNIEIVFNDTYDKININIDDKMVDESIFNKFVKENKFIKDDGKTYLNLKNIGKIEIGYIEEIDKDNTIIHVKDFNELKDALYNSEVEEIIIDNEIVLEEAINIDRSIRILGDTNEKVSLVTENKMEGRHIIISENTQVVIENLLFLNKNEYREEEHRKKIEVGGIENNGSLKLSNVEIKGNIFNYGGGLFNSGYIGLEDVIFNSNYARGMGGAICNIGEINFIGNTKFDKNGYIFTDYGKLQTPYGGAIYTEESITVKEDIDVYFIENESSLKGGALFSSKFFNENNNIVEINIIGNVLFKGNKSIDGGAISGKNIILKGKNDSNIEFINNNAFMGAATSNISMDISDNSYLELSNNETIAGGTIYNDVGNINIRSTKGALFNNNKIKDLEKENYIENQVGVIKEIINDVNYIYDAQNLEGDNNYRSLEYLKDLMLYEFPITKYPLSEDLREQIFKDELEAEECRDKKINI